MRRLLRLTHTRTHTPTDLGHGQSHSHGHADEEGRQEDLGEQAFGVPLGTVEPLDEEAVELAELQPPALQPEAALALQPLWPLRRGRGAPGLTCR